MLFSKTCTIEFEFIKKQISIEDKKNEEILIKKELIDFFEQKRFITKKILI